MQTTPIKPNKILPLIALCLGFFMVIIDVTIVNVALPSLAKDLHVGISGLQWVVAGYTLTFACLLLSAGNLGDRLGAKTAFLCGLALFVLTSLACGMVSHLELLTAFRLLQGVAAALLVPTSLALINAAYENKQDRARAIGVWASVGGLAGASGPVLGALLTTWFGWRAVFLVNIPVGVIAILLTIKYVPNPIKPSQENLLAKTGFDIPGQLLGIISIAALAFSLIEAGNLGWFSALVITGFGSFLVTFIIFLITEYRTATPMFPLKLFKSRTFSTAIMIGMIINSGGYGLLFIMPLYFQQIREYSVLITGLAILPLVGSGVVVSYLGGKVTSMMGPKLPILIGLAMATVGYLGMLIIKEHTPSYLILVFPLIAIGIGVSFTMPAATIATLHSVPENRAGMASGAFNASRQIGSLLGVAVFGTIINTSADFISGLHVCLIIAGAISLFGCVITYLYINKLESAVITS